MNCFALSVTFNPKAFYLKMFKTYTYYVYKLAKVNVGSQLAVRHTQTLYFVVEAATEQKRSKENG